LTFDVGLNPVSVITTLLKEKTDRGVKVTVTLVGAPTVLTAATAGTTRNNIPIIAGNVPDAVVSRTLPAAKVAAAIEFDCP